MPNGFLREEGMKSFRLALVSVLAAWFVAAPVKASDFYVFPVKELEGAGQTSNNSLRPLLDPRALSLLTPPSQKEILTHFVDELAKTYPKSIVGPRQVRDVLSGKHQFVNDDSLACGAGFVAPLRRSYAVVIGITRASFYEVPREGGRVEVLIPITLNIQLVKPDTAKVVASASDTLYSPFLFSAEELKSESVKAKITEVVTRGVKRQVSDLISEIRKNFNPQETVVKLLEKSGDVFVVDKGYEVGFKTGDELVAIKKSDNSELIFKVVNADAGFSVLRPMLGSPRTGEDYLFVFEGAADDSRKPRVLPVTSAREGRGWTPAVSDILVKDIGFKAPFQITPVDVNFKDTMESISRQANCVPWDKFPSAKTVFDSRLDHPQFLLKLDFARSAVAEQKGVGGVKTTENFVSGVTANLVDLDGNVVFSELGVDNYKIERTAGQGISQLSAFEISLKNATTDLSKRLLANIKLDPTEFKISKIEKNQFLAEGLVLPEGQKKLAYDVVRPLGVKISGKEVFMRLELGEGQEPPMAVEGGTLLSYSKLVDEPKRGDLIRVANLPRKGQALMSECPEIYKAPGTLDADFKIPFVRHSSYKSGRHKVRVVDTAFYEDANTLLQAGFFKYRVPPPAQTEICVRSGYLLKVENSECSADSCKAQILSAITLIQEKSGTRVGNSVQAEKIQLEGFTKDQQENFISFKAFENVSKSIRGLTEKFSSNK
jgi:hypothetical protein